MDVDPQCTDVDRAAWAGIHSILVPPDIVAVARRSRAFVTKKTPWHPRPDGQQATRRSGGRDWFSDNLFVEAQPHHRRTGYGTSIVAHTGGTVALIAILWTQPSLPLLVHAGPTLVMPATLAILPVADVPSPARESSERSAPKPVPRAAAAAPAAAAGASVPAPLDAPASITPETGGEAGGNGVPGGVAGGVAGGVLDGDPRGGGPSPGPVRAGGGINPPRKIRDVKPVYPQIPLTDQVRGAVIIEATIGVNGTVQEAKVIQSVPSLDQAALDAVRQWEYAPSMLNGVAVAVIVTVVVHFAIQ